MKNLYLAIVLTCIVNLAQASIVYTDVNPDFSTTLDPNIQSASNLVQVDFNSDGTKEFDFAWSDLTLSGMEWHTNASISGSNEVVLSGSSTSPSGARYMDPLNTGIPINATSNWGTSNPEPLISNNTNGNFQGLGDRYIGVKFTLGANVHYGWILVSFTSGKTLTVKEYAFEDSPNTSIKAGDKTNPIVLVASVSVQGQGGASTISTQGGTLQMEASVLPANATNKSVTWSVTNGSGSANISSSGLLTATGNGTVTVRATANDGSTVFGTIGIVISNQTVPVTAINVQGQAGATTITVAGGSLQMQATVLPANATDNSITWSVTEITGKAGINSTGLLGAIEDGVVTVTATANDGSGITGTVDITISNQNSAIHRPNHVIPEILIYPNPSTSFLTVENNSENKLGIITIHGIDGKVLSQTSGLELNRKIDVRDLQAGMYYITITGENAESFSQKFTKH